MRKECSAIIRRRSIVFTSIALMIGILSVVSAASPVWDYNSARFGPDSWASRFPGCDGGEQQQSPIPLPSAASAGDAVHIVHFELVRERNPLSRRHTLIATSGMGGVFTLDARGLGLVVRMAAERPELHLHAIVLFSPAEHMIGSESGSLEVRYIFTPNEGELLIDGGEQGVTVSVVVAEEEEEEELGESIDHPFDELLWAVADGVAQNGGVPEGAVSMVSRVRFPAHVAAFHYVAGGSFPPCGREVTHLVIQHVFAAARTTVRQIVSALRTTNSSNDTQRHGRALQELQAATVVEAVTLQFSPPLSSPVTEGDEQAALSARFIIVDDQRLYSGTIYQHGFITLLLIAIGLAVLVAFQQHEYRTFISNEREVWKHPLTGEAFVGAVVDDDDDNNGTDGSVPDGDDADEEEEDEEDDYEEEASVVGG